MFGLVGYFTSDPRNIKAITETRFKDQVENLVLIFRHSKGVVDLQPAFFRFTFATTTTLLFGESIETLREAEQSEFSEHFDNATWVTALRLPLAHLSFLYITPSYRKSCKVVRRYADYFIEKAFEHAHSHSPDEATARLYPQVPMNTRSTVRTTCLPKGGGLDGESPVLVPKNADITFSPYHMHRRKELFGEDAHEFRPERWLDGKLAHIGCAYIPFLHGFRTCLGKDFALSEIGQQKEFRYIHPTSATQTTPNSR
ncbi:hypothetical protein PV04_01881 [Phialophora macrospora]|uniref:Cytochrome P450 n=1 Tax=Phialophora macrospora TaxID=1851006 RepID=A0A0D2D875_9EURO|nr:hypothetical protein PV04_01881 [Phialophora macrospora]